MIRVLNEVACAMDFNLLFDRGQQGGVLKLQKMIIFRYFSRFDTFSEVFSQLKE